MSIPKVGFNRNYQHFSRLNGRKLVLFQCTKEGAQAMIQNFRSSFTLEFVLLKMFTYCLHYSSFSFLYHTFALRIDLLKQKFKDASWQDLRVAPAHFKMAAHIIKMTSIIKMAAPIIKMTSIIKMAAPIIKMTSIIKIARITKYAQRTF